MNLTQILYCAVFSLDYWCHCHKYSRCDWSFQHTTVDSVIFNILHMHCYTFFKSTKMIVICCFYFLWTFPRECVKQIWHWLCCFPAWNWKTGKNGLFQISVTLHRPLFFQFYSMQGLFFWKQYNISFCLKISNTKLFMSFICDFLI